MSKESPGRVIAKVPAEILQKYEDALAKLIEESAPYDRVGMAYAEVVYLRGGCNKAQTALKLEVDRRTIHRWFDKSSVEEDVRRWRAFSSGATLEGDPVRVIGPDPESEDRVVVQMPDRSFQTVLTSAIRWPDT